MSTFSIILSDLNKLSDALIQEDWIISVEVLTEVQAGEANADSQIQFLKVRPKTGRTFTIREVWNSFKVKGANKETKHNLIAFFEKYGYALS